MILEKKEDLTGGLGGVWRAAAVYTVQRGRRRDGWKAGVLLAAASAVCVATLKARYEKQYIYKLDMELKLWMVRDIAYRKPKDRLW